jgi:hypothetical protein
VLAAYFRMICFHFAIMLPYLFFSRLHRNGGGMASKGLRSDVPINRYETLMRVMNFAYL